MELAERLFISLALGGIIGMFIGIISSSLLPKPESLSSNNFLVLNCGILSLVFMIGLMIFLKDEK